MEMSVVLKQLSKLQENIHDAKMERAQYQGEQRNLMTRLTEEFGVKTIEEAKAKLDAMKKELEKHEETISKKFERIKTLYRW